MDEIDMLQDIDGVPAIEKRFQLNFEAIEQGDSEQFVQYVMRCVMEDCAVYKKLGV